jgi:hypothetical protein
VKREMTECDCCGSKVMCNTFEDSSPGQGPFGERQEYALCDYCYGSAASNAVLHPDQTSAWTVAKALGAMFNTLEAKVVRRVVEEVVKAIKDETGGEE